MPVMAVTVTPNATESVSLDAVARALAAEMARNLEGRSTMTATVTDAGVTVTRIWAGETAEYPSLIASHAARRVLKASTSTDSTEPAR